MEAVTQYEKIQSSKEDSKELNSSINSSKETLKLQEKEKLELKENLSSLNKEILELREQCLFEICDKKKIENLEETLNQANATYKIFNNSKNKEETEKQELKRLKSEGNELKLRQEELQQEFLSLGIDFDIKNAQKTTLDEQKSIQKIDLEINKLNEKNLKIKQLAQELEKKQNKLSNLINDSKLLETQLSTDKQKLDETSSQIKHLEQLIEKDSILKSVWICHQENLKKRKCIVCESEYNHDSIPAILSRQEEQLNISAVEKDKESSLKQESKLKDNVNSTNHKLQMLKKTISEIDSEQKLAIQNLEKLHPQWCEFENIFENDQKKYLNIRNEVLKKQQQTVALSEEFKQISRQLENKRLRYQQVYEHHKSLLDSVGVLGQKVINTIAPLVEFFSISLDEDLTQYEDLQQTFFKQSKLWHNLSQKHLKKEGITKQLDQITKMINKQIEDQDKFTKKIAQNNEQITIYQNKLSNNNISQEAHPKHRYNELKQLLDTLRSDYEKQKNELQQIQDNSRDANQNVDYVKVQINDYKQLQLQTMNSFIDEVKTIKDKNDIDKILDRDLINKILPTNLDVSKIELPSIEIINHWSTQLQQVLENLRKEISQMREEQISKSTRIEEYNKRKKVLDKLAKDLREKEKHFFRLQTLHELIGKDEFRNFALGLIEKQLVTYANKELLSLCDGRYQLIHENKSNSEKLDFYITDKFKDGMPRKVSTLSGGETFLTSLALALALAEMTRGKTEIEAFFIDEGFGSLDQDSLTDVLEVLLTIRDRGKQIGIISHISNLTDRIPINIQINKSRFGESSLRIAHN